MQAQESQYKLKIGDAAPDFRELPGVDGKAYSLSTFEGEKALVVFWHCNHCPYAKSYEGRLNQAAKDYASRGVGFVAINSNDVSQYPEDSFTNMKRHAKEAGLAFPYLHDEAQTAASAYGALCTPHVFVFDGERKLRYQGRVDGEQHDEATGAARDLRGALDEILAGGKVSTPLTRAFGCGLKWKKGRLGT